MEGELLGALFLTSANTQHTFLLRLFIYLIFI